MTSSNDAAANNKTPDVAGICKVALEHHQAGRLPKAEALYRKILTLDPQHADSMHLLGVLTGQMGRFNSAAELIGQAIGIRPNVPVYHSNLGNVLRDQGRLDDAIACYKQAIALKPDFGEAHNNLGTAYRKKGGFGEAAACHQLAIALNPAHAEAHNNLGNARKEQGRLDDAIACYKQAITLKPNIAEIHNNLGTTLKEQGRLDDAIACYEEAVALKPVYAEAHFNLGIALKEQGHLDDAIACYEQAIALNPTYAEAHNNLGNILRDQGRLDDAIACYEQAIAVNPTYAEAHFNRSDIKVFRQGDPDLATLEALAERDDLPANKVYYIHFALAKALEDSGDYARAFEHMRKGNVLKRRQLTYDEKGVLKLFQRVSTVFDSSVFDRFQGEGDPSSVPIFVLGMPRSGSTLIEQILASHPQIHGAGELTDIKAAARNIFNASDPPVQYPEGVSTLDPVNLRRIGESYLARLPALPDGKVRIIDKLPGNFLDIGLIRLILPNARIIHSIRDPMDTCVSCYSKLFNSGLAFSYDLAELGRYYRSYSQLMTHWSSVLPPGAMIDVSYEDVVDDLEGQARRLIDYCGLPWDDRCLDFHRTSRPVKTASAVQVRKPLYRSSLQRWRRYEADIAPLLHELGDVIPIHAFGTTEEHDSER